MSVVSSEILRCGFHICSFSVDGNFARKQLRKSLAQLPRPKNDYEVVAPEDDQSESEASEEGEFIPDAADVEAQKRKKLSEEGEQVSLALFRSQFTVIIF